MKTASTALKTFLASATQFVRADLYTFTLSGGSVLRYTNVDTPVTWRGTTWTPGLKIGDGGVKSKRGLDVDQVEITVYADETDTVNGQPFLQFVAGNGLDGALVKIERAFSDGPLSTVIGTYIRFLGRFSELKSVGGTQAVLVASSWLELLDVNMGPDVYQSSCRFALYSTGCGASRSAFTDHGTVTSGSTLSQVNSNLTARAAGYFDLGVVKFTSGANNGLTRTISKGFGSGQVVILPPLPAAPSVGDTFDAYPGCDLSMATCAAKFSNLINFGGQPFIPDPTTAV